MGAATATSIGRTGWVTTDLEEARYHLESDFGAHLRIGEARSVGRQLSVSRRGTADFQSGTVRLPAQLSFDCEDRDVVIVNIMRAGTIGGTGSALSFAYRCGDVFLANFPGAQYRCHTDHTDVHSVAIPTQYLAESAGMSTAPRFLSVNPVSPAAAARWVETVGLVEHPLDDPEVQTPLALSSTARMLATTILETFPTTSTPAVAGLGRLLPHHVRRAVAYMEANASADITVWDIADAVGLTPAGVSYLFRRHLRVAPMTHLRRIRLAYAHQELVVSDPRTTTVGLIAAQWGFARVDSFAVLYRSSYGQSPYTTLRE